MSDGRSFGLWTLVALVVGNAIGAGIYTTSGFSLSDLGAPHWVLMAWFVAGLIALCGAVSYGMLAAQVTESGGEYLYLSRSIHPVAGFIAGWISLLAGFPGAIAFAASALESYMRNAIDLSILPPDLLAVGVIVFAGLIHAFKVKFGASAHEWIVALMLMVLGVVVLWGAVHFLGRPDNLVNSHVQAPFSWLAFANSLVWISLSYSGFNAAAYVAGEVKSPETTIMRGMLIGTLITMLLCVAINGLMLYGVPQELIQGKPQVAAISAEFLLGQTGRRFIELVIALSLLTSITAMVLAGPRVYAKMAEDGALPAVFKCQQDVPPRAAILLQVAIAILLVLISDLQGLLSYLGLTLSLCLALAVSSLFVRHWRFGECPNSFWYPMAPLIFVLSTVLFGALSSIAEPKKLMVVVPTILAGVIAYWVSKKVRETRGHAI